LQFAGSAGLDHGGFDCAQRARHRHGQGQALSLHGDQLAWRQIQSTEHRAQRKRQIVEALMNYRAERDAWDSLF
jgi:hypothetical protein